MDKVYIVFGDNDRCDGGNIEGIFRTYERAEEYINHWKMFGDVSDMSIEEHKIDD